MMYPIWKGTQDDLPMVRRADPDYIWGHIPLVYSAQAGHRQRMSQPRTNYATEQLKIAVARARLKVFVYDDFLLVNPLPNYYRCRYNVIVQMPDEGNGVIYYKASRFMTREKFQGEVQALGVPALELRPDSVDWMWAAIEKWLMTYTSDPYQFDVHRNVRQNVAKIGKFKNQRTR
jgi:hypothetical protein